MHQDMAMPIRPMKAVPVGQVVQVESAMPLTILMRTHLWVSWTRIAIDQEAMAKAARQKLVQAAPEDRDGFMLQREADAPWSPSAPPPSPWRPSPESWTT
jgi:hypothetical protein